MNLGYGAALRSGIQHAAYDWIFFIDADMQFDIAELETFFEKTKTHDFIVGYRKKRADPKRRILVSGMYNRIIRLLFGLKIRDVDCAFKLMRKISARNIDFQSNSFFVSVEFMVRAYKAQYRITEIGVTHFPRKQGKSTVTPKQIFRSVADLLKLHHSLI